MNDNNNSELTLAWRRESDGKVTVTAIVPGGEPYAMSIEPQETAERTKYINELCARYPGINSERAAIRKELQKIASATRIDLRFNTCGQVNGRASSSARLWAGDKVIDTYSLNLLDPNARDKAISHLAPFVAGRKASKRKLQCAEQDLRKLFQAELQRVLTMPAQQPTPPLERCPYRDAGKGIVMQSREGEIPLTNFMARIVAIVTRSDGEENATDYELDVRTHRGEVRRVLVKAKEFAEMKWPQEMLHLDGFIHPDRNAASHARAAIMIFSRDPEPVTKTIHTHTGWIRVADKPAYLHAAGAIAADPHVKVEVAAFNAFARYKLPAPPEGMQLQKCVRASLDLLDLVTGRIAFPGYCAIWRSILGSCDCGIFTAGPSGTFKSELAALRMQHFGAGLDRTHLPANWSSTPNSLELLAFAAKDALLAIDDFAPCGSRNDVDALHRLADRIIRAQGNNSGRQRATREGQVNGSKPPRGMILATGEDIPRGQSLRARLMIEQLSPGDIPTKKLSQAQRDAREGLYAGAMAGYLRWLCEADRIGEIQRELRNQLDELRERVNRSDVHRRTPEVIANLMLGLGHFLRFAVDCRAISQEDADELEARAWIGVGECAAQQTALQAENEPATRFLELLQSALVSGEAHFTTPAGDTPDDSIAAATGWWRRSENSETWEPRGIWAGCIDHDGVFLEFSAAYKAAQRAAGGNDGIVIGEKTLRTRLREKGLLVGCDGSRTAVRKQVKGTLMMMVWLAPEAIGGAFARAARSEGICSGEISFPESKTGVQP